MKKILYFMGVDWYWIKQRPQILAEYLAQDYDVTVVYIKELFQKQSLRKDQDELEKSIAVPVIPYRDKSRCGYSLQRLLFHKVTKHINEYDTVWIGHPLLYRYIPQTYKGKIIYDCMDNHEALCKDIKIRATIHETEIQLIQRADLIFASSTGLIEKVIKKGGKGKTLLVRNGVILNEIHAPQPPKKNVKERYKIGYFGTIAEWFDFPLLLESLKANPDIEYYLWGPVSVPSVPKHERLIFEGIVEHRCLWEKVKDMDCLIMPFKLNDIIEDVDPVKLYEYISMGKPVISVYYKEVDRFGSYIYFYKSLQDYNEILHEIFTENFAKYDTFMQQEFLNANTWAERYSNIEKAMIDLEK